MTCQHTVSLGVYLLGALEPAERYEFEAHLAGCDTCRGELVRLSPLPGLLNQISLADFADDAPAATAGIAAASPVTGVPTQPVPVVEPPPPAMPEAPATVVDDTPGRTRRRYGLIAAAAAVVVAIAVGGAFGWQALRHPADPPPVAGVTWTATGPSGVRAEARLVDHEWGTELQVKMDGLPPDRRCYVVVYDHYGNREVGGWWGTDHDASEEIPASTSVPRSKIDRLEFLLDDRSVAVTIEAPGR